MGLLACRDCGLWGRAKHSNLALRSSSESTTWISSLIIHSCLSILRAYAPAHPHAQRIEKRSSKGLFLEVYFCTRACLSREPEEEGRKESRCKGVFPGGSPLPTDARRLDSPEPSRVRVPEFKPWPGKERERAAEAGGARDGAPASQPPPLPSASRSTVTAASRIGRPLGDPVPAGDAEPWTPILCPAWVGEPPRSLSRNRACSPEEPSRLRHPETSAVAADRFPEYPQVTLARRRPWALGSSHRRSVLEQPGRHRGAPQDGRP
ncbi:uncharacterized protein LOC119938738 [Tachyglossus aculeatus]|uniref:uncharacterized protein LOC119938738 n=1 Tax=Tachyglossus aculeatus TaxID=9261 RepID=UPI0018F50E56|nr:uncharacterized protein LOC119938738 [Tachyglossus aculeatus]